MMASGIAMRAPPGLEHLGGAPAAPAGAQAAAAPRMDTHGAWVDAVANLTPYLDAQGLRQALKILDAAIEGVQRANAVDLLLSAALDFAALPALQAVKVDICSQQQGLLQELCRLRANAFHSPAACSEQPTPCEATSREACAHRSSGGLAQGLGPPAGSDAQKPRGSRPQAQAETLSTSLQLLAGEDPECLFVVRRISKLGFKAGRRLKRHFAAYGSVVKVLVAHSTSRQPGDMPGDARRRPSSLGFVHMASAKAARAILALGQEQEVEGVLIRLQRFERLAQGDDFDAEDGWRGVQKYADFERQQSSLSNASTRTSASMHAMDPFLFEAQVWSV